METNRLEAFSDGVLAIIITIMVLELKMPQHAKGFADLQPILPVFLSYVLSFLCVGICCLIPDRRIERVIEERGGNNLRAMARTGSPRCAACGK